MVVSFDEEKIIEMRSGEFVELIPVCEWLLTDNDVSLG